MWSWSQWFCMEFCNALGLTLKIHLVNDIMQEMLIWSFSQHSWQRCSARCRHQCFLLCFCHFRHFSSLVQASNHVASSYCSYGMVWPVYSLSIGRIDGSAATIHVSVIFFIMASGREIRSPVGGRIRDNSRRYFSWMEDNTWVSSQWHPPSSHNSIDTLMLF